MGPLGATVEDVAAGYVKICGPDERTNGPSSNLRFISRDFMNPDWKASVWDGSLIGSIIQNQKWQTL